MEMWGHLLYFFHPCLLSIRRLIGHVLASVYSDCGLYIVRVWGSKMLGALGMMEMVIGIRQR